ncbi:MAG: hypothetical protein ACIARR_00520 [Phycisphaerales bacterium JB059]
MGQPHAKPTSVPPPDASFDDGMDENALLDMISGIESRLGDLRDATLAMPEIEPTHATDAGAEPGASADHPTDEPRLRELERREREIAERERLVHEQSQRIDHECHQLEQARVMLTDQREAAKVRTEAIREARADLERRAQDLDRRAQELDARDRSLAETAAAIEARGVSLDEREAELDRMRDVLMEQQRDMERDSEQYAQLQGDMAALFERLSEAEAHAMKSASTTDANPELESRWRELEQECTRLKRELSTTRKTLRETESKQRSEITDPAPAPVVISQRGRDSAVLAAGWLIGGAVLALATLLGIVGEMPQVGVSLLGGVFAAYFVAASHVAKRLVTPSTIAFALLAATFGLWIPIWTEGIGEALRLWDVPLSYLPLPLHATAPLAIAVLTSGFVMAWAIYLVTSSGANFGAACMATLVATSIALVPIQPAPLIIAAVLWNAILAAALTRWALNASDEDTPGLLTAPSLGSVPRRPAT